MNIRRTPNEQAEVEKLITDKNVVGSKKSRFEGTRMFALGVNFRHSLSMCASENSTTATQNRLFSTGFKILYFKLKLLIV